MLWMIERSETIAATPIATQTKKNTSRRQDALSSRARHAEDEGHQRAAGSAGARRAATLRAIVTVGPDGSAARPVRRGAQSPRPRRRRARDRA